MLNVAILGNCQSTSLFHYFSRSTRIDVVALLDINCQETPDFDIAKQKLLKKDNIDVVISQPLGEGFGEISTSNLRKLYGDRFLGITNIFFSGLHPDLSYFGNFGTRVYSPLGDYHSKLALLAFAKQLTLDQCLKLYKHDVYEQMGYYQVFENSKHELLHRDEKNEIKFASKFFELTESQLSIYAVNHPTKEIVNQLGLFICKYLDLSPPDEYGFFYDSLIESTIWPLYPEVVDYHKLPYKTEFLFYPHLNRGIKPLTLEQFVKESYIAYENLGYEKFMSIELASILNEIPISY